MKNQKGFSSIAVIFLVAILAASIGYFAFRDLETKSPQPVASAYNLIYAIGHSSTVNQIQVVDSKIVEPKREGFLANPSYDYKFYLLNTNTFVSKEISVNDMNKLILINSESSPDGARVIKESQEAPTYNSIPVPTGLIVSSVFFEKDSVKKSIGKDYEPTEVFRVIGWVKTSDVNNQSEEILADETADWQTYRNEKYGFEFKYPKGWRNNLTGNVSFLDSLIESAKASVGYEEILSRYEGKQGADLWIQDPHFDQKPLLEEKYNYAPQYYQYSKYNSAPQGIFVYVWENGKYYDPNRKAEEIDFQGIKAFKIIPRTSSEFPDPLWYNEAIEVKKSNNLFLIFYAGEKYQNTFELFVSTFKFTQ